MLVFLPIAQSCSAASQYGLDRARDLSDVVDVRYGTGFGLGASVQYSMYWEAGIGCSTEWYQRQWFGRKSVVIRDGMFAYGVIIGYDGDYLSRRRDADGSTGTFTVLFFNLNASLSDSHTGTEGWFNSPHGDPPVLDGARVGGAVFLPLVNGGAYLNIGETIDFLCGLVGYDMMNDDGYPKFFTPDAASLQS